MKAKYRYKSLTLYFSQWINKPAEVEKLVSDQLNSVRSSAMRRHDSIEWYRVEPDEVVTLIWEAVYKQAKAVASATVQSGAGDANEETVVPVAVVGSAAALEEPVFITEAMDTSEETGAIAPVTDSSGVVEEPAVITATVDTAEETVAITTQATDCPEVLQEPVVLSDGGETTEETAEIPPAADLSESPTEPVATPEATSNSDKQVDEKIIIRCPQCNQQCRVPKGKTLEISCPKCRCSWVQST